MRNRYTKSLLLLSLVVVVTACLDEAIEDIELLEQETDGIDQLDQSDQLLSHEAVSELGIEASLISSYSLLLGKNGFYSGASNWLWGSVLGGDANKGTNAGDQSTVNELQAFAATNGNTSVLQKYNDLYEAIRRANFTLSSIAMARSIGEISPDVLTRTEAEARFLRGHFYFDVKKNFNNGPYIGENWNGLTPQPNDKDLWPFIESDFQFAFDNLPETQDEVGRANKWAAGAYLAKALLFQQKYADALLIFDDVIANGVTSSGETYGLVTNYPDVFRAQFDNSLESVFSTQAVANSGDVSNANPEFVLNFPHGSSGPDRPGGCCGFFQPSFDLVNSFRTDANGLPLLDNSYNGPGNALVNDMGLQSSEAFTPDAGNLDPRLDHAVGRRGIPYLDWGPHPGFDWLRDQSYGGPYSPKKFSYYKAGIGFENDGSSWTPGYTAVNYNIIRFADVLLLAAEAEVEAGDLSQALVYVNQVRTRAANALVMKDGSPAANYVINNYTSFSSQTEARNAVRFERKLELSGEGHRFYDLVRWGLADVTLNAYLTHEDQFLSAPFSGASFTPNQDEYLPIPQEIIDMAGGVIVQNPGH